jgi:hypothetical protein
MRNKSRFFAGSRRAQVPLGLQKSSADRSDDSRLTFIFLLPRFGPNFSDVAMPFEVRMRRLRLRCSVVITFEHPHIFTGD